MGRTFAKNGSFLPQSTLLQLLRMCGRASKLSHLQSRRRLFANLERFLRSGGTDEALVRDRPDPLGARRPAAATPTLYVARAYYNEVTAVDPVTYNALGTAFADPALVDAQGLALGPNGHVYVVSEGTGAVLEFDPSSGQLVSTVVSGLPLTGGGLGFVGSELAFGPNGDLYLGGRFDVGGSNQFQVRRYDPASGALLDTLVGVLPGFAFGSDDLLYGSQGGDILRYDPDDFDLVDVFAGTSLPAPVVPTVLHLAFAADGTLLALAEGYDPTLFEAVVALAAYDASGALIDATAPIWNPFTYADLAIDPATGDILALTDQPYLEQWDFLSSFPTPVGNPGFASVEMLFVPEGGSLSLLALAALALRRRAK